MSRLIESSLVAYIMLVLLALDLQAGRICCFSNVDPYNNLLIAPAYICTLCIASYVNIGKRCNKLI